MFRLTILITILLISGLFIASCDLVSKNKGMLDPELVIQTEKEQYTLGSEEVIYVTLENYSGFSLFTLTPPVTVLEKKTDGEWEELGVWYMTIAIAPRFSEIEAGERIFPAAPRLFANTPIFSGPGEYRFRFTIFDYDVKHKGGSTDENLLPIEKRVSNSFQMIEK